jgi:serine phosphatase RsbU (regulator of sigma subunit)
MDSRLEPRDMAAGNRELLETLGVEASIVLENARLLEEERGRRHIHEELAIARNIQQSLLPRELPETGWLRANGYSLPSRQVGGDYYDIFPLTPDSVPTKCWAIAVADVAGKGVGSALVAALLQGAFLGLDENPESTMSTPVIARPSCCARRAFSTGWNQPRRPSAC